MGFHRTGRRTVMEIHWVKVLFFKYVVVLSVQFCAQVKRCSQLVWMEADNLVQRQTLIDRGGFANVTQFMSHFHKKRMKNQTDNIVRKERGKEYKTLRCLMVQSRIPRNGPLKVMLWRVRSTCITLTSALSAVVASRCVHTCRSISTCISPTLASSAPPVTTSLLARASCVSTCSAKLARRFTTAIYVGTLRWSATLCAVT